MSILRSAPFLAGVVLILIGFMIDPMLRVPHLNISGLELRAFISSIGVSLISSVIYAIYSTPTRSTSIADELGLKQYYPIRSEITSRCAELLISARTVDIAAIRLKTLLDQHGEAIKSALWHKNIRVRILVPNPISDPAQVMEELIDSPDYVNDGLKTLRNWEKQVRSRRLSGSLSVKYTNKLISNMYQRIDNTIFTGPYMGNKETQDNFTIECVSDRKLGITLSEYFHRRFEDANDSMDFDPFIIEFMGMPGAGKTSCSNRIRNIFPEILYYSNENVECFPEDEPIDFNKRVSTALKRELDGLGNGQVLLLDRGLYDFQAWIKVHTKMKKIDPVVSGKLVNDLPKIPRTLSYYKILFIQTKEVTNIRRTSPRHRADEWALSDEVLTDLYTTYLNLRKSDTTIYKAIDCSQPLSVVETQVVSLVTGIINAEKIKRIESAKSSRVPYQSSEVDNDETSD